MKTHTVLSKLRMIFVNNFLGKQANGTPMFTLMVVQIGVKEGICMR